MEDLSARPTGSIPVASGGWAETKAAERLLDNPAWDGRERREGHTQCPATRLPGHPVGLCIQDTTELDFTCQPSIVELGRLS